MKVFIKLLHTVLFSFFLLQYNTFFAQTKFSAKYLFADSLFKEKNYKLAYPLLLSTLTLSTTDSLKAETCMRLGGILTFYNKTDSAIYFHKMALEIWEKQKNLTKVARTYRNIGVVYAIKKNFAEASTYYKYALSFAELTSDSIAIYIDISVLLMQQKQFDSSFKIIRNNLNRYKKNYLPYQEFRILNGQGVFFLSHKKYDSAIYYLKKSIFTTSVDRFKSNVYNDIAESYRGLKNYTQAFTYQDSAYLLNIRIKDAENLLPFYDTYTNLYKETGNYKQALYYAELHKNLSDSFFDVDKYNALQDAEAKYQNEKTKAEKAIVEKDNKLKQRNLLFSFVGLGLVALLAFMGLRSARIRKKANNALTTQKIAIQKLADELSVANQAKARLFSTISHDLRSPLSSLYAHVKLNELKTNTGNDAMSKNTTQLLDTLEELLVWSKSQMDGFVMQKVKINLYNFFEELKDFYNVLANTANVHLQNDTAQNVFVTTDENILKTIFRNLISNAVANTAPGKSIIFNAVMENNAINISVKNACTKDAFNKLQNSYVNATVKSNVHGFGTVLIKEFAQKVDAKLLLHYDGEFAVISFVVA